MKWLPPVLLLLASTCSQAAPANLISFAACSKQTTERAKANGFVGITCDLLDSLQTLQDALVDAAEDPALYDYAKSLATEFMGSLIVVDCAIDDGEFKAVSVSDGVTIYADLFRRHPSGLRVGVVTTASRAGDPLQCGTYQPVGYVKFKTISGFDTQIMVIKPYAFPAATDEQKR